MKRRNFIHSSVLIGFGLELERFIVKHKTHNLTFNLDGFKKSFYKIAELFKEYNFKAYLNVIAIRHVPGFVNDKFIPQDLFGNFYDWNKLKSMGQEEMPHTWDHKNLTQMPLQEAKQNFDKCFDFFERNFDGYEAQNAVYNFAYNASNQDLDAYALKQVKAIRTGGWLVFQNTKSNATPYLRSHLRPGCWGHGPELTDAYVESEIKEFVAIPSG